MLSFLLLICALASGVMGFGPDGLPVWSLGKPLFAVFLLLALGLFAISELKRPSLLWAVYDDLRDRRKRRHPKPVELRILDRHPSTWQVTVAPTQRRSLTQSDSRMSTRRSHHNV